MRWGLAVTAALAGVLAAAPTAVAGTGTTPDGNDRPGALDIKSAAQGHQGNGTVTHTISTWSSWNLALVGTSTPNYFAVEFSTDADAAVERTVLAFSVQGRMRAWVFNATGGLVGPATASRPNNRTVRINVLRSRLGSPEGYRWQAFSFFRGSSSCRGGCLDRVPNAGRVLHDLKAPAVSFPQPGVPAAESYDVAFTVSDAGGSGFRDWRLERRTFGTAAWAPQATGTTDGAQTVPITAVQGQNHEYRVVARDLHGNTTTSPVRIVSVPTDDTGFTYGPPIWPAVPGTAEDFLETLHQSSTAGDTATYIFDGRYVALIGRGGSGVVRVEVEDGTSDVEQVVDLATFSGSRQVFFQTPLTTLQEHTLTITVQSGTFSLDGIIYR